MTGEALGPVLAIGLTSVMFSAAHSANPGVGSLGLLEDVQYLAGHGSPPGVEWGHESGRRPSRERPRSRLAVTPGHRHRAGDLDGRIVWPRGRPGADARDLSRDLVGSPHPPAAEGSVRARTSPASGMRLI
jgi:hypothetical protein